MRTHEPCVSGRPKGPWKWDFDGISDGISDGIWDGNLDGISRLAPSKISTADAYSDRPRTRRRCVLGR